MTNENGSHKLIAILEDHALFAFGLEEILKKHFKGMEFSHFRQPRQFLKEFKDEDFDLLFIDINLGDDLNGVNVVEELRQRGCTKPVVIITSMSHVGLMARLLSLKVNAYLMKDFQVDELLKAVEAANSYKTYIPAELKEKLEDFHLHSDRGQVRLTPRELDIAHYVIQGLSSKEIADILSVSMETIKSHRKNIKHKVGYENVIELKEFIDSAG